MRQPILRSIIAGVALCLFSANPVAAGSAANDHLTVSCSLPRVVVTVDNTQFDVFAPGYTNLFEGDVNVAAINGWTLVDPSAAELPLKMKGGDVEPYAVTRPPEDARAGTIYFHNYCIMSDQDDGAKYIGVAPGVTVKYTAYKNGAKCPSDWTVNGQTKKNTTSIIFNRDWWDVPEWLTPSMKTPKPGIYVIDAHDVNSNVLKDDGEMAVFGADFVEDGGHIYGFDDYTGWDAGAAGYYSTPKTGRCVWPYASVQVNQWGCSELKIKSWGVNRTFDIECDREGVSYYPETTIGTARVDFFAGVQSYNETGNATLTANYDGVNLAQLRIVPFNQQTRKVLVVNVNNASSSIVSLSNANDVFKQCVTEFEGTIPSCMQFSYTAAPNVWDLNSRDMLLNAVLNDTTQGVGEIARADTTDHVILVISGTDIKDNPPFRYLGWGQRPGRVVWLYSSATQSDAFSHELGHNFGLTHVDEGQSNENLTDKENLMTAREKPGNRLRYEQWKTVNRD